jgi:hypothetical protein
MNVEQAIKRIEEVQAELATAALRSPNSRDAFEYGRVSGMYAGLERAIQLLSTTEEDDDV